MATTKTASAPKAEKKAVPKATAAKPAAPKKEAKSGAKIKVTQTGSPIGRRFDQQATLIGLGLNKTNRSRVLEDTPAVRGMIAKIAHLVRAEKA